MKDRIREWIHERRLILDASSLDEASMSAFAKKLIRFQPSVIQAYANTLGLFAQFVKAENIKGISPRGIVCSAECLTEENRTLIEETFGCPVYNRYGSREFSVIASECSEHQGMHINAENLLVEVLSNGKPCIEEDGEIVITDLKNFAMPMIRYRIKDVGRIKEKICSCSRGLPLMELSGGRTTDFLTATNDSKVSGIVIATYVITNLPGIRQIQFVQNERGSVTVNLAKGRDWSSQTLVELTARVQRYLGQSMQLQVVFADEIPLEKSGKYRFSKSTLAN
jgi:phenylacetate-CoA ligase